MFNKLKLMGLAAAVAIVPTFSSALTLTVDDLGTAGVDSTTVGGTLASTFGTVGGFEVAIASGSISSTADSYTLNTTSIQVAGTGTLQISAEQTGLTGFPQPFLNLTGSGSVTDHGTTVTVEHMIDLGGGYQTVGSVLSFVGGTPGPVNLSDITNDTVAGTPTFDLKTVITVTTASNDQTANVNATLVASVPLPAGGLLLLTALGGVAVARRRKAA
ncbi:MAG: VPLPA-CTERM sorting domain-containing protein [Sedimentitalea sp.]